MFPKWAEPAILLWWPPDGTLGLLMILQSQDHAAILTLSTGPVQGVLYLNRGALIPNTPDRLLRTIGGLNVCPCFSAVAGNTRLRKTGHVVADGNTHTSLTTPLLPSFAASIKESWMINPSKAKEYRINHSEKQEHFRAEHNGRQKLIFVQNHLSQKRGCLWNVVVCLQIFIKCVWQTCFQVLFKALGESANECWGFSPVRNTFMCVPFVGTEWSHFHVC